MNAIPRTVVPAAVARFLREHAPTWAAYAARSTDGEWWYFDGEPSSIERLPGWTLGPNCTRSMHLSIEPPVIVPPLGVCKVHLQAATSLEELAVGVSHIPYSPAHAETVAFHANKYWNGDKWIDCRPGYHKLMQVLHRAYEQASAGKGHERHANGLPFEEQPMQTVSTMLGSNDFMAGQVLKKIIESRGMKPDQAVRELLGAINYIAGMVIRIERTRPQEEQI